jgi:hypothetical protein
VYLSGLEDTHKPVQTSSWLDGFDVGPNGFLRPHRIQQNEPSTGAEPKPHSPRSSFSLAGNKAATPGKASLVQERGQARQLISGRNFRDILEACRPRQLGASLPLPLKSLLSLKQFAISKEAAEMMIPSIPTKESATEDVRLREWGTVDFGDMMQLQAFSRSSRSPSPSTRIFQLSSTTQSNPKHDKTQIGDSVSPGSSFGSSPLSSSYGGTSFDRVFWDYYDSPKTPRRAFQIQRSPSFEFDEASIEIEKEMNDDSMLASDNASKSSHGGESDTIVSQSSKVEKHIEQLRQFMDAYDTKMCKQPLVNVQTDRGEKGHLKETGGVNASENTSQAVARFHR